MGDATVVAHGRLIDGTGADPIPSSAVVVEGGRIVRVGKTGDFQYPDDATVVNLTGRWIVPGFMDLHAHMNHHGQVMAPERQAEVAETLVGFGITTIRSTAEPHGSGINIRGRIASGKIVGPRMFTADRILDLAGGFLDQLDLPIVTSVGNAEDVRAEANRQVQAGADFVKLYCQLSPNLVRAGIEACHQLGVRAIGHLGATNWTQAARLGINTLTHSGPIGPAAELVPAEQQEHFRDFYMPGPNFDPGLFDDWLELVDLDGPEFRTLLEALKDGEVEVNPDLVILEVLYWVDEPEYLERVMEPQYANPEHAEVWRNSPWLVSTGWSPDQLAAAKASLPVVLEMTRRFHEAGILLTAGSDLGNSWVTPGVSLHRELELLHRAGIPAIEVLTIATRNGAEALGILDDVGTVEPGKRSDLVVLTADPVADIRNTRSIEAVYLGERRILPAHP